MKTYLVYSLDGYTEDIKGKESNMCQMLGIFPAEDESSAYRKALEWLAQNGYEYRKLIAVEIS